LFNCRQIAKKNEAMVNQMQEREEKESPASLLAAVVIFILWFGFVINRPELSRENATEASQQQTVEEPALPTGNESAEKSSPDIVQPLSRHRQKASYFNPQTS